MKTSMLWEILTIMVFNLLTSTPSVRSIGEMLFSIKAVFLSRWHLVNVRTVVM